MKSKRRKSWTFGHAAALATLVCAPEATAEEARDSDVDSPRDHSESSPGPEAPAELVNAWSGHLPPPQAKAGQPRPQAGPPVLHTWRAPNAGCYRLECFPTKEPPFRYSITVTDLSAGRVLHQGVARATSLLLELPQQSRLGIRLTNLGSNGDDTYDLRLVDVRRER